MTRPWVFWQRSVLAFAWLLLIVQFIHTIIGAEQYRWMFVIEIPLGIGVVVSTVMLLRRLP